MHGASSEKILENVDKSQDANKFLQESDKIAKHYKKYGFNLPPEPIGMFYIRYMFNKSSSEN